MRALWTCGLLLLAATSAPLDGDQILARAGAADGLNSYSVPVHFDVHMRRPIGVRDGVDAIVYFKAPARAALTITKIPGIIGMFFRGIYAIDLAPQVWPAKYLVNSVSPGQAAGASAFVLHAVPKADPAVDHVEFTVAQANYAPIAAAWFYKDGSTIRVTMACQTTSNYNLVKNESIEVSMPHYRLDATAAYGAYALNAPVPDTVFGRTNSRRFL
ncbi:MAG: hypothetical protein WCC70_06765 [Candidatus Aquilonibacter sp.]|jgi:hypothetical protein